MNMEQVSITRVDLRYDRLAVVASIRVDYVEMLPCPRGLAAELRNVFDHRQERESLTLAGAAWITNNAPSASHSSACVHASRGQSGLAPSNPDGKQMLCQTVLVMAYSCCFAKAA